MNNHLRKKVLSQGLPPPYPFLKTSADAKSNKPRTKDYSPLEWIDFFDNKLYVTTSPTCKFNVYTKGHVEEPVLLLLHGGGYSGLTWASLARSISELIDSKIVVVDSRGHGDSATDDDDDLSAQTQANDLSAIINSLYGENVPKIFLVGHSMGGAIAVHAACHNLVPNLIGLAVIDVVEGSALDALSSMQSFLHSRPQSFKSLESAIEWCVRSGQVRNLESARISMPGQIIKVITTDRNVEDSILEETDECQESEPVCASSTQTAIYRWRIDLSKTERFWNGWFEGLSQKFLAVPAPKLLILAGVDRLDKDLTIGQMQGKFQMVVLPKVGHCVHEDSPDKVAQTLAGFLVRNRFATPKNNFTPSLPGC